MRRHLPTISINAAMIAFALLALLPFFVVVSWSLKTNSEIFSLPIRLIPSHVTFSNYPRLFSQLGFTDFFKNSILVALGYTFFGLLWSSMGGWALAHYRFRLRTPILVLLVIVIAVPYQVLIIALYLLVIRLHIVNTLWALIIPFSASPYGILFMRQYMLSLPEEVVEAARLDGAGEIRIFRSIVLPMAKPGLAALAIFLFLDSWNDFLWPLIAIQSERHMTLQLGLSTFQGAHATDWTLLMAGNVMAVLPMLLVFVLAQRQFVNSIAAAGVKG
jgi:ABC-type glycerol-3-phosphate transport system permease component